MCVSAPAALPPPPGYAEVVYPPSYVPKYDLAPPQYPEPLYVGQYGQASPAALHTPTPQLAQYPLAPPDVAVVRVEDASYDGVMVALPPAPLYEDANLYGPPPGDEGEAAQVKSM